MKIDKFLESKGIDPAQIVSYHYSEVNGDPPANGIDFDVEELLKEFGEQVLDEAAERARSLGDDSLTHSQTHSDEIKTSILSLKDEL